MTKYIEYDGESMSPEGGGADLGGYGIEEVRADVIQNWDRDTDVVKISTLGTNSRIVGFILFSRPRGIYVWAKPDGTARRFNPATGKLTTPYTLPPKGKKNVLKATKEHNSIFRQATVKKKTTKKKTVRRRY